MTGVHSGSLESPEGIDHRWLATGIAFHLSKVNGPLTDRHQAVDIVTHIRPPNPARLDTGAHS
jgi:hypothetical protein